MNETSESEVKAIVEGLIPDADQRELALKMMAEAIREANVHGRGKWVTQIKKNECILLVGHLIVYTIHEKGVWMSCDQKLLEDKDRVALPPASLWAWDDSDYPAYKQIPARNAWYSPDKELHSKVWPGLRRLLFEAIYKAARTMMDPRTPATHCPGVLQYLRNTLDVHVPDPLHHQ